MKYFIKLLVSYLIIILLKCETSTLLANPSHTKPDSIDYFLNQSEFNSEAELEFAKYYTLKVLAESKEKRENVKIADCCFILGKIYQNDLDLNKSNNFLNEALKYYKLSKNSFGYANTLIYLGINSEKQGLFNKALLLYIDAHETLKKEGNIEGQFTACNNIGTIYYQLANNSKALSFYLLAYKLSTDTNIDTVKFKELIANIGAVYYESWKYDSALFFFSKVKEIEEIKSDSINLCKTFNSIGNVFLAKNEFDKASENFRAAGSIAKNQNDIHTLSSAYYNIGNLFFQQGEYKNANTYYDSCLQLASENNLIDILISVYYQKSNVFEKLNNYRQSLEFLKLYQELQYSFSEEKGLITETESLLLKQEKENKILQLEKEQEKKKTLIVILISAILLLSIISILYIYIIRLKQKNKFENALAELQKRQFQAALEAQDFERKRIAGDLHDSVGQMLSLTKLNLSDLIDRLSPTDKAISIIVEKTINILDEACNEVRIISHNLMPGSLVRLGLVAAIKDLIRQLNQNNKFKVDLKINNLEGRLAENIEIALYRILQEILNNTIKHSKASNISIELERKEKSVCFCVSDNGVGLNTETINSSTGIGWKNIYSRLATINGSVKVDSSPGNGLKIIIDIPI